MNIKNKTILVHQSSVDKSKKLEYCLCVLCLGLTSGVLVLGMEMCGVRFPLQPLPLWFYFFVILLDSMIHSIAQWSSVLLCLVPIRS